jgi:hypothetical protein
VLAGAVKKEKHEERRRTVRTQRDAGRSRADGEERATEFGAGRKVKDVCKLKRMPDGRLERKEWGARMEDAAEG